MSFWYPRPYIPNSGLLSQLSPLIAFRREFSASASLVSALSLKYKFPVLPLLAFQMLFHSLEMHISFLSIYLKSPNHLTAGCHSIFSVKPSLLPEISNPQSPSSLHQESFLGSTYGGLPLCGVSDKTVSKSDRPFSVIKGLSILWGGKMLISYQVIANINSVYYVPGTTSDITLVNP